MFKYSSSLVKASNFNPLNPDLLTLYRRPNPIKIWPTYAVMPTTTLYPRSTYDLWRAGSSPTIFQPVEKLIPLTTTSQSGPDQPPLYFRPTYALPNQGPLIADPSIFPERERAGGWSGLWCERALTEGPCHRSVRLETFAISLLWRHKVMIFAAKELNKLYKYCLLRISLYTVYLFSWYCDIALRSTYVRLDFVLHTV